MVVGDSITHFNMLQAVNKVGDLTIAFNANKHVPKCATMSFASAGSDDLWMVLSAWEKCARPVVERAVRERQKAGGTANKEWFHWLDGIRDMAPVLDIPKEIRCLVREGAAEPG